MTDIVARLRGTTLYQGHGEESDLPEQAADEIERLRGKLDAMQGHIFFAQDSDGVLRRWHPPTMKG